MSLRIEIRLVEMAKWKDIGILNASGDELMLTLLVMQGKISLCLIKPCAIMGESFPTKQNTNIIGL